MERRIITNPELEYKRRELRGNKFAWIDKEVLRFFRKEVGVGSKRHYANLTAIYVALCQIESDFSDTTKIKGLKKTIATYCGKSKEVVAKYFYLLEQWQLVSAEQVRYEDGQFGGVNMYLSEFTDQRNIYYTNKEWFDEFMNTQDPRITGIYSQPLKTTYDERKKNTFPVNKCNFSVVKKNNLPSHEKAAVGESGQQGKTPLKKNYTSSFKKNYKNNEEHVPTGHIPSEHKNDENVQINEVITPIRSRRTKKEASKNEGVQVITKKQQCFMERTQRLVDIISKHHSINKRSKIHTWWKHIEKLHTIDGIELKRIDAVLDWYQNNIGGYMVPEVASTESFREKFIKLENAIKRCNTPKNSVSTGDAYSREAHVKRENEKLGTHIKHGVDDTFKDRNIKKNHKVIYSPESEPNKTIMITYSDIVDLIKAGKPSPDIKIDSFYNRVKVLEGL